MTDRIDDLIQRLRDSTFGWGPNPDAERIIRAWAGEQQQVVADKEIEQVANDESQQDWNDLSYRGIHREAFMSGARWMRDKSNVASTTTPQPVAGDVRKRVQRAIEHVHGDADPEIFNPEDYVDAVMREFSLLRFEPPAGTEEPGLREKAQAVVHVWFDGRPNGAPLKYEAEFDMAMDSLSDALATLKPPKSAEPGSEGVKQ